MARLSGKTIPNFSHRNSTVFLGLCRVTLSCLLTPAQHTWILWESLGGRTTIGWRCGVRWLRRYLSGVTMARVKPYASSSWSAESNITRATCKEDKHQHRHEYDKQVTNQYNTHFMEPCLKIHLYMYIGLYLMFISVKNCVING